MKINAILACCTLSYFQYSLQLMLELLLIMFTISTRIEIKKVFLYMIIFIERKIINHIKSGEVKQINIKNRTYYFYNDIIDLKNFDARFLKTDKKSYKDIDIYNI